MRVGMIILLVLSVLGLVSLVLNCIGLVGTIQVLPALGAGLMVGVVGRIVLAVVFLALVGKWLGSQDTSQDRLLLVRALKASIAGTMLGVVSGTCIIIFAFYDFEAKVRAEIVAGLVGDLIAIAFNVWWLFSANDFYAERLKAERGGQMV